MGNLHECGCAMKLICPPCPLGLGRTCGPFWQGWSSSPCTFMFFIITGIFAGCAGKTAIVKTCTSPPPPEVATTITGLLKVDRGGRQGCL